MNMPLDTARRVRADTGLASGLAVSVSRLSRRLRQERDSDLTATQLSALGTLRRRGALTVGALAAYEKVRPPSMTRTVNCLARTGMVVREPHPTDRRLVVLHVSAEGAAVLDAERRRRDVWLAKQLRSLPAEHRELLRQVAPLLEELAQS